MRTVTHGARTSEGGLGLTTNDRIIPNVHSDDSERTAATRTRITAVHVRKTEKANTDTTLMAAFVRYIVSCILL
jgi:hypothetical protein